MEPEARRLHRLSWLFLTVQALKGLVVPAIFLIFASRNNPWARYQFFGALILIPVVIGALIKQRIYSYRFGDDQLIVTDGLLTKKVRHIPYERIHNIAQVQNPLHRMLGVASARVETAGGGKPEAVMHVLPLEAIDELRRRTLGIEGADPAEETTSKEAPENALLRLPSKELVKLGLISRRGLILFAGLAGLLSQMNWWEFDWFKTDWRRISTYLGGDLPDSILGLFESTPLITQALIGIGLALAFLVFLLAASVVWHLIKYHGFTLSRERGDLRRDYGLFTKVSSLIPVRRIQLISSQSTLVHRWFRRASIEVETAGSSESGSDLDQQLAQSGVTMSWQYLAPILEADRASGLLRKVLPNIDLDAVDWQPLSARARRRLIKRATLVTLFFTLVALVVLSIVVSPLAGLNALWLPVVALPLAYIRTNSWLRYSAWSLTDHAVYFRSGWLDRAVSVVPLDKIQTVTLNASPFDRRRHMASVAVDTAGAGTFGHRIDIPYLDREVASTVFQKLYAEVSATEFDW